MIWAKKRGREITNAGHIQVFSKATPVYILKTAPPWTPRIKVGTCALWEGQFSIAKTNAPFLTKNAGADMSTLTEGFTGAMTSMKHIADWRFQDSYRSVSGTVLGCCSYLRGFRLRFRLRFRFRFGWSLIRFGLISIRFDSILIRFWLDFDLIWFRFWFWFGLILIRFWLEGATRRPARELLVSYNRCNECNKLY